MTTPATHPPRWGVGSFPGAVTCPRIVEEVTRWKRHALVDEWVSKDPRLVRARHLTEVATNLIGERTGHVQAAPVRS